MLFPKLGPSILPVVVAQPDKRYAKKTASVLKWYDRHRAEYNVWFKRRRRLKQSKTNQKKNFGGHPNFAFKRTIFAQLFGYELIRLCCIHYKKALTLEKESND